ncbi:MAG: GNAT family N-acetyltransferase [Telluria sp.]
MPKAPYCAHGYFCTAPRPARRRPAIDGLAVAAFDQFKDAYADWPLFKQNIGAMSALSAHGEIIVAQQGARLVGAVAYIGPQQPKSAMFDPAWPIMRMLVVAPEARGIGVGRALALACIARARRDKAAVFALHTSELMAVALPMYQRMGFAWHAAAPSIHGVAYGIYLKQLEA